VPLLRPAPTLVTAQSDRRGHIIEAPHASGPRDDLVTARCTRGGANLALGPVHASVTAVCTRPDVKVSAASHAQFAWPKRDEIAGDVPVGRLAPAGEDVVLFHDAAVRHAWNGLEWTPVAELDAPGWWAGTCLRHARCRRHVRLC
jgi:hypothetical protein